MVREIQPPRDLGKCPTSSDGKRKGKDSVENPAEGREDDQETVNRKRKEAQALMTVRTRMTTLNTRMRKREMRKIQRKEIQLMTMTRKNQVSRNPTMKMVINLWK